MDGNYEYAEQFKNVANGAYGLFITKYSTEKDAVKIYLRVNDMDTLFNYNLKQCNCDSLMIGHNGISFVILNENQYPWFND